MRVLEAMESQQHRTYYSSELRAKIAKFAAESCNKAAVEKFSIYRDGKAGKREYCTGFEETLL